MNRRRWIAVLAALAAVAALDTAAWLAATSALRAGAEAWAARENQAGWVVDLGAPARAGWPFRAALAFDALRLRAKGLGIEATASLVAGVSPTSPDRLRAALGRVRVTAPGLADLTAEAASWIVDVARVQPDRAEFTATALTLRWAERDAIVGRLEGSVAIQASGTALLVNATDLDLARSGVALPSGLGSTLRSLVLRATVVGDFPSGAGGAADAVRAWRDNGGAVEVSQLDAAYGPLQASLTGKFGLDAALRPAGDGVVAAHGVIPLLDALAASGAIASRTAQAARGVLMLLGGAAGDGDVQAPVRLADGRASIAGFPLARLPALRWDPEVSQ